MVDYCMLPCPGEPTSPHFKRLPFILFSFGLSRPNPSPALAPEGYIYIHRGDNIWDPSVAERTDLSENSIQGDCNYPCNCMKWEQARMSGRKALRKLDDFFILTGLGIARESATLILQHYSLAFVALVLLFPASAAIILSHAFLDRILVAKLALGIQAAFGYGTAGLINPSHHNYYTLQLFYRKLAETILSYVLCFPFLATFSLWARAAVAHTVADTYAGNRPSWQRLIQQLPKLWQRLVVTYIWVCLLILGFNALMFVLMSSIINGASILGLPAIWAIGAAMCGGILYSIVFAHAMIVCNLATIVCVMEADCCYGLDAVFKAMFLIRGRTQIALLIALVTNMTLALVESLFQYRVMGMRHGSSFYNENSSRISSSAVWEAPLLIFMYSTVGVMEGVMSCVFYYTCKSSRLELRINPFLNYSSFLNFADAFSSKHNYFTPMYGKQSMIYFASLKFLHKAKA